MKLTQHFWRRFLSGFVVATALSVAVVPGASAHELGQDHDLAVELHVEPNDTPIAGEATTLRLFFAGSRSAAAFDTAHCTCHITMQSSQQTLQTLAPLATGATTAEARVMFPRLGSYTVVVSGNSTDQTFPSFRIPFIVNVEATSSAGFHLTQLIENAFILGGAAVVVILILCWRWLAPRRLRPPRHKSSID